MATLLSSYDSPITVVFLTRIMGVAAVVTAFPVTTLSGTSTFRFKTAHATRVAANANAQIVDEQGDILAVYLATGGSNSDYIYTQKGAARVELEASRSAGY